MKIAFVDTFGLCYDGNTLTKRGLGGSESAVILCSRELAKLGFDVTVFNDCVHDDTQPGYYDNVWYRPLQEIESTTDSYDVLIGSRSVAAFAPLWMRERFKTFSYMPDFSNIQQRSNHKVLWMHDTFCDGDDLIEQFLLDGFINEVFTLSDWHTVYVSTCDHGKRRMFEVMKKYMFVTRNGMTKYHDWIDITKKDPNHFVYNSSVTKGMRPLVYKVWPQIRERIPDAKLTIIGGYYRMRSDHEPDAQEIEWRQMVENNPDINFTGVIKQSEIADILCDASFMIYPADFPETFGISTLESLYYNTPVITCYFGALEETAFDAACYKMPYCVVPNGLYPNIDQDGQAERFVMITMEAYNNKYLHQQKMYACNAVKDICGWDSVALQWKQHLFHKLGEFMPVDEYRKAQEINYKVRKTFGRRFVNEEELQPLKHSEQKRIGVITAVYNAENYIEKCIRSVAAQDYEQYHMYIIDDASTDNTVAIARETIESLPPHLGGRFTVLQNSENVGAVANHFDLLKNICTDEYGISYYDLYMIVDGDDWLVNDPNIFHRYNNIYHGGAQFTYGSCWSLVDNIPLVAQPYPPEVKNNRDYRNYKFTWNMPYTHLRTFHADLIFDLTEEDIKLDGRWPKAGGDTALFYYLIEKADPDKVICVSDINYVYNDTNPINDYKVNGDEQNRTAAAIMNTHNPKPREKTILIAIPTNKNIEAATFKSIYDLKVPEGYKTHFQFFYGYQIDQIRNLIAEWGKGYDYLFCVDSDIVLPSDTLTKMIGWDKDIISGLYIQRIPEKHTLEIYHDDGYGGTVNTPWENIKHYNGIHEIAACGFGCVLIKSEVLRTMEYPHFVYKSAIDHANTLSEDVYFCTKARSHGFTVWCDTTILCDHVGSFMFKVDQHPHTVREEKAVAETDFGPYRRGPKQAIVIRTYNDALSASYADLTEQSCRNVDLEVVRWHGFNKNQHNSKTLSEILNIKFGEMDSGAACCTASHFGVWMHIASLESDDPVVILEHDALMLHYIPEMKVSKLDNAIVALGYKVSDPQEYDYKAAMGPNQIIPRKRHSGSHAYMITPKTARLLLQELKVKGAMRAIDNFYFMRVNEPSDTESDIPLALMVPTPAIGWIRKSTIWEHPSTLNYDVHESFSTHLNQ